MRTLAIAATIASLAVSSPARSDSRPADSFAGRPPACALGRVDRKRADSRGCLSCHDGITGPAVSYAVGHAGDGMRGSHPVDVDYTAATLRPGAHFRPRAALPAGIVLPGGKVACVSCHDGASRGPGRTAVSMERSLLCFSCHDL